MTRGKTAAWTAALAVMCWPSLVPAQEPAALSELLQMARQENLPEVTVPNISVVSVEPAMASAYATDDIVQALFENKRASEDMFVQMVKAASMIQDRTCDGWWSYYVCREQVDAYIVLLDKAVELKSKQKEFAERLFLLKEFDRLNAKDRSLVENFFKYVLAHRAISVSTPPDAPGHAAKYGAVDRLNQIRARFYIVNAHNADIIATLSVHYGSGWVKSVTE